MKSEDIIAVRRSWVDSDNSDTREETPVPEHSSSMDSYYQLAMPHR